MTLYKLIKYIIQGKSKKIKKTLEINDFDIDILENLVTYFLFHVFNKLFCKTKMFIFLFVLLSVYEHFDITQLVPKHIISYLYHSKYKTKNKYISLLWHYYCYSESIKKIDFIKNKFQSCKASFGIKLEKSDSISAFLQKLDTSVNKFNYTFTHNICVGDVENKLMELVKLLGPNFLGYVGIDVISISEFNLYRPDEKIEYYHNCINKIRKYLQNVYIEIHTYKSISKKMIDYKYYYDKIN